MRDRHTQHTPHRNIIHIMPVVLAARYSDQRRTKQRREKQEHACEVGAGAVDMALSSDEEGEVA